MLNNNNTNWTMDAIEKESIVSKTSGSVPSMGKNPLYLRTFVGPIVRENRAWFIVFLLLLVIGAQAMALWQLFPLKERIPYVMEVERTTGRVVIAENVLKKYNVTQANVDYFLAQWVKWVDSLNENAISRDLPMAASWTRGDAVNQLQDYITRNEYAKRIVKEPSKTTEVQIKTISYINEGKNALVRYDMVERSSGNEVARTPRLLTATLTLITPEPGSDEEKTNPIGVTISRFSIANETAR
jgi:type IV secretory pathway component VirB8